MTSIPYTAARVYTLEESAQTSTGGENYAVEKPFFEVEVSNTKYDSRTMGLGEIAAFYLWWSLEKVSDHTILLIEEPESFLSPTCQTAFAAVLAQYTATKKPFVVVTTHSPQIIQSAAKPSLRFVYKDGKNSKINGGDPLDVLLKTVGIENKVRTLILVEDNAARVFCKLWISQFASVSVASFEIKDMGGDGNVVRALKGLPKDPDALSLLGLLDGDAEGKEYEDKRIAFLPGGRPIESIYREMVTSEIDRVEPILGIENIRQILFPLRGLELHEWFEQLKLHSNLSSDQLHLQLFKAWIEKPENRDMAANYYKAFLGKLNIA